MSRFNFYSREAINNFYSTIKYTHFKHLSNERQADLEELVEQWRHFFEDELTSLGSRMTFAAEKLTTSPKKFDLNNGDEKAYFFVRMVDPNFLFLEAKEIANTKEDFVSLCKSNFGFVDTILALLEKEINNRFQLFDTFDLIERGAVKKIGLKR